MVDDAKPINENSPLTNKLVRKAVNYALDRDELVTYMRKNIGKGAAKGFLPKGMPGYDQFNVTGFDYNPDTARTASKSGLQWRTGKIGCCKQLQADVQLYSAKATRSGVKRASRCCV